MVFSRKLCRSQTGSSRLIRIIFVFIGVILFFWSASLQSRVSLCEGNSGYSLYARKDGHFVSKVSDPEQRNNFYQIGDMDIYLYSASYDNRYPTNYIRLFGMQNREQPSNIRCRITFADGVEIDLPIETSYPIYKNWPSDKLLYHAYYYGCEVPNVFNLSRNFTFSVFLDGRNHLNTVMPLKMPHYSSNSHQTKDRNSLAKKISRDVVICVKAIWGQINATRLVEWMEFQRLLGVRKVVMYDTTTTGPSVRVLEYYTKIGFLELIPYNFALQMYSIMERDPFRSQLSSDDLLLEQTYLVSMNDCYYRYSSVSDYILIIDIDEVVVPNEVQTLPEVLQKAEMENMNVSAFLFQTAWHLEEFGESNTNVPPYLHMQQYLKRSPVMQSQPKAAITSNGAIVVNWHGAVTMPIGYGFQGNQYIQWQRYGYVHHYRAHCKYDSSKCSVIAQMTEDDYVIPKYMDLLKPNVHNVVEELNLL